MSRFFLFILIAFGFYQSTIAGKTIQINGFGVASWGMSRNDIITAEGTSNILTEKFLEHMNGSILVANKEVMGKKSSVLYNFEKGCTANNVSKCIFSGGVYSFDDGSKELSNKIEKTLSEKYGPTDSVENNLIPFSDSAMSSLKIKGKAVTGNTVYTRYVGKVKIEHTHRYNVYDYTKKDTSGAVSKVKAGPIRNYVSYYGPYYYKIDINKKKVNKSGF